MASKDESQELGSYKRKDGNEKISATVSEFKGRTYFSFRSWFRTVEGGEWQPGKNGINLPDTEEPDFIKLLVKFFGLAKLMKGMCSVFSAEEIHEALQKEMAE